MLSIFSDWFIKVYKSIYYPQDVFGNLESINEAGQRIIKTNFFNGVATFIMTIAVSMMLIYFLTDLYEKSASNMLSLEQMFLALLKLVLIVLLMKYSQNIIDGMIELGTKLKDSIQGLDTTLEECWFDGKTKFEAGYGATSGAGGIYTGNEINEGLKNPTETSNTAIFKACLDSLKLLNEVTFLVKIIPPYLIALVGDLFFYMIMISRSVELALRSLFCPIAIANAFSETRRSTAVRYMKKIFALSLQFAIAIIAVLTFNVMIKASTNTLPEPAETFKVSINEQVSMGLDKSKSTYSYSGKDPDSTGVFLATLLGGSDYWGFLAFSVAKVVVLAKSQSLANDIAGAS